MRAYYAQKPPLNTHADIPSGARRLNVCLNLHQCSCFAYASSEGSVETTATGTLVLGFAACLCDKYLVYRVGVRSVG